jgi:hypothetical protein
MRRFKMAPFIRYCDDQIEEDSVGGHVACIEGRRSVHISLIVKSERKRPTAGLYR